MKNLLLVIASKLEILPSEGIKKKNPNNFFTLKKIFLEVYNNLHKLFVKGKQTEEKILAVIIISRMSMNKKKNQKKIFLTHLKIELVAYCHQNDLCCNSFQSFVKKKI